MKTEGTGQKELNNKLQERSVELKLHLGSPLLSPTESQETKIFSNQYGPKAIKTEEPMLQQNSREKVWR